MVLSSGNFTGLVGENRAKATYRPADEPGQINGNKKTIASLTFWDKIDRWTALLGPAFILEGK